MTTNNAESRTQAVILP